MLAQIREKNSSSAMAGHIQPIDSALLQSNKEDQGVLEGMESTYLQNHQSQPLSILGADNQLAL